jgi:hypothetical protein
MNDSGMFAYFVRPPGDTEWHLVDRGMARVALVFRWSVRVFAWGKGGPERTLA